MSPDAPMVVPKRPLQVAFDVLHLYYLPQFEPVWRELVARGAECLLVLHVGDEGAVALRAAAARAGVPAREVGDDRAAAQLYASGDFDWVVFGNDFPLLEVLAPTTRSATLYHGIGIKDCYYDPQLMRTTVRFCEGEWRAHELTRRHPNASARVVSVGFAKLDPLLVAATVAPPGPALAALGLDPARQTVLYAPTYYPSSIGCLPHDWPTQVADLNLIVKLHQFSFSKPRYRDHLSLVEHWRRYPNVFVAPESEYSLLNFMSVADVLVSEASSAMFEFAALDRPVVWCDFLHLRWQHRGPLRFRLEARMDPSIQRYADMAAHARRPADLAGVIRAELAAPGRLSAKRKSYVRELIGPLDGHAAARVADELLSPVR